MYQFVQIRGASSQETFWFSRTCNAVAGQIDHILRTTKLLQSAYVKGLEWAKAHRYTLFLTYYCSFDAISTLLMGL